MQSSLQFTIKISDQSSPLNWRAMQSTLQFIIKISDQSSPLNWRAMQSTLQFTITWVSQLCCPVGKVALNLNTASDWGLVDQIPERDAKVKRLRTRRPNTWERWKSKTIEDSSTKYPKEMQKWSDRRLVHQIPERDAKLKRLRTRRPNTWERCRSKSWRRTTN